MIKVECVSCKSPYELDPRRVPDKGMKMRCPKCGTSFMVSKEGSASPVAAVPVAAPPVLAPPPAAGAFGKQTMLGQGVPQAASQLPPVPPQAVGTQRTAIGIAPPVVEPPSPRAAASAVAFGASRAPLPPPELDLPSRRPTAAAARSLPARSPAARGAFGATLVGTSAPTSHEQAQHTLDAGELPALRVQEASGGWDVELPPDLPAPKPPVEAYDLSVSRMFVDALPVPLGEVDLPAPKASAAASAGRSVGEARSMPAKPSRQADDLDLPVAKGRAQTAWGKPSTPGFGDLDLPVAKAPGGDRPTAKKPTAGLAPPALWAELPALDSASDLPTLKQAADLPTLKRGADLPMSTDSADLPALQSVTDLPALQGATDLPVPIADLNLPARKMDSAGFGDLDLPPARSAAGFGDLEMPALELPQHAGAAAAGRDESSFADLDLGGAEPPAAASEPPLFKDGFGDIPLPPPKAKAGLVPPKAKTIQGVGARKAPVDDESSFGDLELDDDSDSELPPSLLGEDESSFGGIELDDEPAPPSLRVGPHKSLPGDDIEELEADDLLGNADLVPDDEGEDQPDGFGEYGEEEGDEQEVEGDEDDEEMEFGISGEEGARGVQHAPDAARRQRGEEFEAKQAALGKRTLAIVVRVAIGLVLVVSGAAALKFTPYGVFGIYYWERWLPEAGDPQFTRSAIEKAEKIAVSDTYPDIRRSLAELGSSRAKTGINRALLTRSLLHESLFIVRFGEDASSAAHAAAIVKRLGERSWKAPFMELARAADAARRRKWTEAAGFLQQARKDKADPYVELLAGEVALATGKLDDADKAFAKALQLGAGARAQWGIARVALQRDNVDAQTAAVDETLKQSPMHSEARIAEAHLLWNQGKDERALHLLRVALGLEPTEDGRTLWSAKQSIAGGYSLLGYVHETRGRLHQARDAYDQALAGDPYRVDALLGSGRVSLREKRFNDALARFESALSVATKGGENPIVLSGRRADIEAQLGIGRALSALDRDAEAKSKLEGLSARFPNDSEVILALGETEHAMGHLQAAEADYRKSIELSPKRFDGYLALAQLFFKKGDAGKASEILNEAASQVEESAEMRRMLGQSEMARGRLESAIHEFKRSLELDPHDMDAMFGMAAALRKHGDLDQAEQVLSKLAERDAAYAGLAEQRGLLFEARGDFAKATQAYRDALAKDPGNMALMLRLGGAQVEASEFDAAEQTLAKVIREMPNSAEAEYFIGRVAFGRGRTPDALTHFDRAVALDGTKGEFHLYVARASLEMGNLGRTLEEAQAAINFAPELGDSYWVRAMVRLRMGAVKDALLDLAKALKMKPSRTEAYAVRGDAYEQLRQLPDAILAYRTALGREPKRGEWWYRLGALQADAGSRGESGESISHAIELGDTVDPMPYWLPDAYRLAGEVAETKNDRTAAVRMYKRYVAIAPPTAIDRSSVERKLKSWGVQLGEDE